jgi:hypothetical protein
VIIDELLTVELKNGFVRGLAKRGWETGSGDDELGRNKRGNGTRKRA